MQDSDVWGLKRAGELTEGLFINNFDPTFGSPNWARPEPNVEARELQGATDNYFLFQFVISRPVTVVHKTVPTVLDGCLRVGGLLAFLKIFSTLLTFVH